MSEDNIKQTQPLPEPAAAMLSPDIARLCADAYPELHQLARSRLRASGPLTLLDTAGLVSDTYQRLVRQKNLQIVSRGQFLAYCSRVMRSIIIDLVREKHAQRRGGNDAKITLNTAVCENVSVEDEPLRVDEALADLNKLEPRLVQVVEMRYFGGYSEEEIGEALGITVRTVQRDWQKARMLLQSMLTDPQ